MIWNNQILDFAGYKMDDGIVLGDASNVDLTTAIIELGWTPPQARGRWNLLPLVTMAEGDKPAMMEIPEPLSNLVNISHPRFRSFAALDLKWKALTRPGFDIGGVQYTAAPFIGWFIDAEIAVRDLADTFRYNVLPDIVEVWPRASCRMASTQSGIFQSTKIGDAIASTIRTQLCRPMVVQSSWYYHD